MYVPERGLSIRCSIVQPVPFRYKDRCLNFPNHTKQVWRSADTTLMKILWTLLIFFLPLIGLLIWFLCGPRGGGGARAGGLSTTGPARV